MYKSKPQPPEDGVTVSTTTELTKTSAVASIILGPSNDKNNIAKGEVSNDYSSTVKNGDESQQIAHENLKPIQDKQDISNKLFDEAKTNNFIILAEEQESLTFKCFHCNQFCSSDIERIGHIDSEHPGKLYYPNPEDFENRLTR